MPVRGRISDVDCVAVGTIGRDDDIALGRRHGHVAAHRAARQEFGVSNLGKRTGAIGLDVDIAGLGGHIDIDATVVEFERTDQCACAIARRFRDIAFGRYINGSARRATDFNACIATGTIGLNSDVAARLDVDAAGAFALDFVVSWFPNRGFGSSNCRCWLCAVAVRCYGDVARRGDRRACR